MRVWSTSSVACGISASTRLPYAPEKGCRPDMRRIVALLAVIALLLVVIVTQCRPRGRDISQDQQGSVATIRLGVHENYQGPDKTSLERTMRRFPAIDVTREFEADPIPAQDLVKRIDARCGIIWSAGKSCVWSVKPSPADVRSGAWKPYVLALAQHLVADSRQTTTVIVIWHEPENDVPKWFKSPAEFVRYFNTLDAWLKSVDPSVVTSHAALGYRYSRMTVAQARRWVTHASVQSIDIYSGRSFPLAMTLGTSVAFQRWKASRPAGSRWAVSERGWIATDALSAERAASILAESDWLASLVPAGRPDFYIVWNTPGSENDPTLPLDAAGRGAVNAMFKRLTA